MTALHTPPGTEAKPPGCNHPPDLVLQRSATSVPIADSELVQVLLADMAQASRHHLEQASEVKLGRFRAIGEVHELGRQPDWRRNPSADAEWLIAIHKLPFLLDLAQAYRLTGEDRWVEEWCHQLQGWLGQIGTGELPTSDAQVEARRVEHIVRSMAVLVFTGGHSLVPPDLIVQVLTRVCEETEYLLGHLKPSRNHRTFQLHAAYLAALWLEALQDDRWQAMAQRQRYQSCQLLIDNLLTDFGRDGVHVELSTHYHQITLQLGLSFVALARYAGDPVPHELEIRLRAALNFSLWSTQPGGGMPLINDADDGDNRPLLRCGAELYPLAGDAMHWVASEGRRGSPPRERDRFFPNAGYLVFRDTWGDEPKGWAGSQQVFVDVGELGAGSHAHYDLFSFCYSVNGHPLVVDPGRYTYHAEADADGIDWRHRFKRTAAHNTICIDGLDQTRYYSKARQPAPGLHRLDRGRVAAGGSKHGPPAKIDGRAFWLEGASAAVTGTVLSHEYAPRHMRFLVYAAREYLLVIDRIESDDGQHHLALHNLQLDAAVLGRVDAKVVGTDDRHSTADGWGPNFAALGQDWSIHVSAPNGRSQLTRSWISRDYGVKLAAPAVQTRVNVQDLGHVLCVVAPRRPGFDVASVRWSADERGAWAEVTIHDPRATAEPVACLDRFDLTWPTPATPSGRATGATGAADGMVLPASIVHERWRNGRAVRLLGGSPSSASTSLIGHPCS